MAIQTALFTVLIHQLTMLTIIQSNTKHSFINKRNIHTLALAITDWLNKQCKVV